MILENANNAQTRYLDIRLMALVEILSLYEYRRGHLQNIVTLSTAALCSLTVLENTQSVFEATKYVDRPETIRDNGCLICTLGRLISFKA